MAAAMDSFVASLSFSYSSPWDCWEGEESIDITRGEERQWERRRGRGEGRGRGIRGGGGSRGRGRGKGEGFLSPVTPPLAC